MKTVTDLLNIGHSYIDRYFVWLDGKTLYISVSADQE
jgi:hypothetical protein